MITVERKLHLEQADEAGSPSDEEGHSVGTVDGPYTQAPVGGARSGIAPCPKIRREWMEYLGDTYSRFPQVAIGSRTLFKKCVAWVIAARAVGDSASAFNIKKS
jgi:hypothetical protein